MQILSARGKSRKIPLWRYGIGIRVRTRSFRLFRHYVFFVSAAGLRCNELRVTDTLLMCFWLREDTFGHENNVSADTLTLPPQPESLERSRDERAGRSISCEC